MMRRLIFISYITLAAGIGATWSSTAAIAGDKTPAAVEILGSQRLPIHSTVNGMDYELQINLPRNYWDTTKTFPVLFLLDSQWDFPLVTAIFGEQYYDGFVPDIVIVGIAAAGPNPNFDSLRARDLTPTAIKATPQSGSGAKYLAFIKQEVIPLVESKYRVKKDDRALMGSSLGGLFTLYAMFHETALFNRYILTSPSVGWDNGVLFTYEKEYAAKNTKLPVHLYIARAELEGGAVEHAKFLEQLKARKYGGLDLTTAVSMDMGHSGGKAYGYARGLQAAYARPLVTLEPFQLDPYVGKYEVAPGVTVSIVREANQLVLVDPGGTKLPLRASSDRDFFMKGTWLCLKFEKNDAGVCSGVHIEQFGGSMFVKKVDSK